MGVGEVVGYSTIESESVATHTVERSEFVSRAYPVSDAGKAMDILTHIRSINPKARHTAWAYVLADGSSRSSDDGEPSGTAGRPILDVVEHEGLRDVAVYVTRFFGGVLLGTGGLVRAYTLAAQLCLRDATRLRYLACIPVELTVSYALYDRVVSLAERMGAEIESPQYAEQVSLTALFREVGLDEGRGAASIGARHTRERVDAFVSSVHEMSAGRVVPHVLDPVVRAVS
jgi:uncharacterized YigZ family protein